MIDQLGASPKTYYYVLNLQGDVVKLVTESGAVVASYEYDAWGNILSQSGSMADVNPLRYRGYYYDVETGFYYLQSRYYDPANRRFINADVYASTGQGFVGTNMFAYCNNNPVSFIDYSGNEAVAISTIWTLTSYVLVAFASAYVACVVCLVILPHIAQKWEELARTAGNRLSETVPAAINTTQNAELVQELTDIVTAAIWRSYAAQRTKQRYSHSWEIHHIVAQGSSNPHAVHARSILAATHIRVNSKDNLIPLKTGLHRRLHTNVYYTLVDTVITNAYEAAHGNPAQQRQNVLSALGRVRQYLQGINELAPY